MIDSIKDPTQGGEAAYIPFSYHADFIDMLADNPDVFQIITYDDLPWQQGEPASVGYPGEKTAWDKMLADGTLNPRKIHVLIQHDVDTRPERTMDLVRYEASRGIPSNVMIFNRRVNRRKLAQTGVLEFTPYELDTVLLQQVQGQGFVIGYHSNAYEQALYDLKQAQEIFKADVAALRQNFDIRFFTAHGGTPGPDNLNNRDLPMPEEMQIDLIWAHNGATPRFDHNYSDGGINSMKRDPTKRDLRDFVRDWQVGKRYRILTHPQYYHDPCGRSPRLSRADWYEGVLEAYSSGRGDEVWQDVMDPIRSRLAEPIKAYDGTVQQVSRKLNVLAYKAKLMIKRVLPRKQH